MLFIDRECLNYTNKPNRLVATQLSKRSTNDKYTYGYVRADVIAGLLNSFALICIAMQIMFHATGRLVSTCGNYLFCNFMWNQIF